MPLVIPLLTVQAAQAASPGTGTVSQAAVHSSATQTTPTPTPPPNAAPDQSRPADTPGAAAPTTAGQPAPNASQGQKIPLATNASGLKREVFGYATAGSLADPTIGYPSWNFNLLSTVAFFALHVQYDGQLVGDSNFAVWDSSVLTGLVNTARAHGVKVVVTIVGPHNPVDLCDALYNTKTTIPQLMRQVIQKGIDGVNIDYEGQLTQCQNVIDPTLNATNQTLMTNFARDMRAGLNAAKPGYYLSIATYSGSASGNDGFFNIPNLNPYVDSFFVMAYDMDAANQGYAPLNCSSFCLAPVSPLANYYWNDTTSMSQYSALVGPGKTILGQPYYGRVACVASPADHAKITGPLAAATYMGAAAVSSSPDVQPGTFAVHRDDNDPNGLDRWDSWYDNSARCWREMHWSDATTLAVRYDFVNQMNLRGVGLWTLNYGGGSPELWSALQTYFLNCYSLAANAQPASPQYTGIPVTVTAAGGCPDPNPLYQFWVLPPGASSYQLAQAYSTNSTYTWNTTGLAGGSYHFSIWVRDANSSGAYGNQFGRWDTYNSNILYTVNSRLCTGLGASIAPGSQAAIGTPVTVTALATSCPNPQYQFWILPPGASSYQLAQAYSTNASLAWNTVGIAPGMYRLSIWARDASSTGTYSNQFGGWDAYNNNLTYILNSCSAVSTAFAPPASAQVGTSVTISAHASGCANPQFQFWVLPPGGTAYQVAQAYSATATYAWNTSGQAPGNYAFSVWVRDTNSSGADGNQFGRWDAYSSGQYNLSSCSGLNVSASPPNATSAGKPVTFTASASGCSSPLYQFWILPPGGTAYQLAQAYSSSGSLAWSTTGLAPGTYRIAVWARDTNSSGASGNQFGRWDVYNLSQYQLS